MTTRESILWDQEYNDPKVLSVDTEPTTEFKTFVKWLRKNRVESLGNFMWCDLGCGVGRNLLHVINNYDGTGLGYDISPAAIAEANSRKGKLPIEFVVQDLREEFFFAESVYDVVIDSTTSHALPLEARKRLAHDMYMMLRPGGYAYVRAFVLDGDRNARNLIKMYPGDEPDSYIHPQLGIEEYMLKSSELKDLYSDFTILYEKKYTGYQRIDGQPFKRRYITLYLYKPE